MSREKKQIHVSGSNRYSYDGCFIRSQLQHVRGPLPFELEKIGRMVVPILSDQIRSDQIIRINKAKG